MFWGTKVPYLGTREFCAAIVGKAAYNYRQVGIEQSGTWRPVEPVDELREHPRFSVRGRANIYGKVTLENHEIVNLSVGGICVQIDHEFEIGDRLKIDLLRCDEVGPVPVEGEVMWTFGDRMGLRFTCGPKNPKVLEYVAKTRIEVVPDTRDR